ncbi:MAG: hypothetical protein LQ352_003314 [Teloschistes flavicans]|nr:MAG: hypothetical protein LQ352_003314 [Teloschistes flavicans]
MTGKVDQQVPRYLFRELKGKKKPVEQRKIASLYLKFLKSSQRFYRSYAQALVLRFGGLSELEDVAKRFSFECMSRQNMEASLTNALLRSCHRTLIHLGDLSRYRESELEARKKEKNWGPAIGYYDLAIAINPSSGIPYNQLAIISKAQKEHARTLYNLYRALSAYESPPTAFDNLNLEFKKIREARDQDRLESNPDVSSEDYLSYLQHWFPFLHACCFDGINMIDYRGLECQTLERLAAGLETCLLKPTFVNQMVLSNIAADFAAGERWQDAPEVSQNETVFRLFQRFNVRTFSLILRLLQVDCDNQASGHGIEKSSALPSIARRLLPCIRYYQSWLTSRAALLSIHLSDAAMSPTVRELWKVYAATISSLVSITNFEDIPRLDYLLEEDEEVLGFRPLQDGQPEQRYFDMVSQKAKLKCHGKGVKRHHPNIEMLCRVRDFVEDALELAQSDYVPLHFDLENGCFVVEEDMLRPESSQTSLMDMDGASTAQQEKISHALHVPNNDAETTTDNAVSLGASTSLSLSNSMNQMVDDLVDHDPSNDHAPSSRPTAPNGSSARRVDGATNTSYGVGDSTLTALEIANQMRSWSPERQVPEAPRPILPSILNFPFAPRPDEKNALTQAISSQPPSQHNESDTQSQQQQMLPPQYSLDSTSSSMSEPTQLSYVAKGPHPYQSLRSKPLANRKSHVPGLTDDFTFDSSNIIPGSSFPLNSGRDLMTQPTPPNGQG